MVTGLRPPVLLPSNRCLTPRPFDADFAEGEAPHKALFAKTETYCADIYYFRTTLRSVAAVPAHIALGAVDRVLAAALGLVGLRGPVSPAAAPLTISKADS